MRQLVKCGLLVLLCGPACAKTGSTNPNTQVTPASHSYFPITSGVHAADCSVCHSDFSSFQQFTCFGCHAHDQAPTDPLHVSVPTYLYDSKACYSCHPSPVPNPTFDHTGITNNCATCHAVGQPFASLPVAGFNHPPMNGADCGACHGTTTWLTAGGPSGVVHDATQNVTVAALIPTYSGTSIATVSPQNETLVMGMNHATTQVVAAGMTACANCHINAAQSVFYPGNLHASLANLQLPQPTQCSDCHSTSASSMPVGFVGPTATDPPRTPSSGEMKHDAVNWSNGVPTATGAVPTNCAVCHITPSRKSATWAMGSADGGAAVKFHASLTSASLPQPVSCVDCHANSRTSTTLTAPDGGLPPNVSFDHATAAALDDCASCHTPGSVASAWTSWSGGKFHLTNSSTPSTCLPCHAGERPVSTTSWISTTYGTSPFDYVVNAAGIAHGDGQDCAVCHTGAGTGAWGINQNWVGGHFAHGPTTVAQSTCIACHMTERPDLRTGTTSQATGGYDHSLNATGDCFGCHQASVDAGTYVAYPQPLTTEYSSDWRYGQSYPGSNLIGSSTQFIKIPEITLVRSGANNLVTGTTTVTATLYNEMLHTSAAIPASMNPGDAGNPNLATCPLCHLSSGYAGGQFHPALTDAGFPQPMSECIDCHTQMRPAGIVEHAASELVPMDHNAQFTGAVTIGGQSVTSVSQIDCATCHHNPGTTWTDGTFHPNIAGATPKDCTVCHYPLMADKAQSDVDAGVSYGMRHASVQLTFQNCQTCHTSALGQASTVATTAWRGSTLHTHFTPQPTGCVDCHAVSEPAASTQSTWTYVLGMGGTLSNQAQWMNHASGVAVGKDCVVCHATDAKTSASAWNKSDYLHPNVTNPQTCDACHGLGNGVGTTDGQNNNLPNGLTNSSTYTTASNDASTGVPPNTPDQVNHADINISGHQCNFCHTQVGISTVGGVQGKEWAQASFHVNFAAGNALIMNGSNGRCSNCHMNVRPGAGFAALDHSTFTDVSGSKDCSSCHSLPGTGTLTAPNWLGAAGVPQFINVGGFNIPVPPATAGTPPQPGIANLPHPTVPTGTACTACHATAAGGKMANGYDHASPLIATNCDSCHEAGSNLLATPWNGNPVQASGAGDTRPFNMVPLVSMHNGRSCTLNVTNHFYPDDCSECHLAPTGTAHVTTGTAYLDQSSGSGAWTFPHQEGNMHNACNVCHGPCPGD